MTHVQVQSSCSLKNVFRAWKSLISVPWTQSVGEKETLACLEQPPIPRADTTQSAQWHCVLLLRKLWNTIGCYCDLKLWLTPGFFERLEHEKVTFCMAPLNTLKLLYKNMSWLWGFGRFGRMNGRVCSARLGHCSGLMSDSCFTLS